MQLLAKFKNPVHGVHSHLKCQDYFSDDCLRFNLGSFSYNRTQDKMRENYLKCGNILRVFSSYKNTRHRLVKFSSNFTCLAASCFLAVMCVSASSFLKVS